VLTHYDIVTVTGECDEAARAAAIYDTEIDTLRLLPRDGMLRILLVELIGRNTQHTGRSDGVKVEAASIGITHPPIARNFRHIMSSQGNDMSDHSENGMDRRRFINGVGVALLTVQVLPWIAHASASPSDGNIVAENLIIHSGPGFVPHTHDLLVPYALLKAPPREGVKLESTMSLFHTHDVVLSQEILQPA
jgi:hypothetical protein